MKTRNNVAFYTVINGFATYFGNGKEITLGNGNTYAIINNIKYFVEFDGINNQTLIPV